MRGCFVAVSISRSYPLAQKLSRQKGDFTGGGEVPFGTGWTFSPSGSMEGYA